MPSLLKSVTVYFAVLQLSQCFLERYSVFFLADILCNICRPINNTLAGAIFSVYFTYPGQFIFQWHFSFSQGTHDF